MSQSLIIKNMVCPRCMESVRQIFEALHIPVEEIRLGEVIVAQEPPEDGIAELKHALRARGFELLDDRRTRLINQIKSIIIHEIHYREDPEPVNFSVLLADQMHYEYGYISRLFSSVEGRTIESYVIAQKIEKVKELLTYGEMTLAEIADQMQYSSTAHLSAQFKKETGMTPTEFRRLQWQERQSLDAL